MIKSVTCDRSVVFSTNKTDRHDITEILLKVVLNTIKPTNQPYVSMTTTLKVFSLISFNMKIQLIDQIHINLFFVASGLSPSPIGVKSRWYSALLFGLFHGETLNFDYHFIFNLFEVLFNYLHMNPCEQIYSEY